MHLLALAPPYAVLGGHGGGFSLAIFRKNGNFIDSFMQNFVYGSFSQEDYSEVNFKQMHKLLNFTNYCEIFVQPIFQEHFLLRNSQNITQRAL